MDTDVERIVRRVQDILHDGVGVRQPSLQRAPLLQPRQVDQVDLQPVQASGAEGLPLCEHQQGACHVAPQVVEVWRAGVGASPEVHVVREPEDLVSHVVGDGQFVQRVHSQAVHLAVLLLGAHHLPLHVGLLCHRVGGIVGVEVRNPGRLRQRWGDVQLLVAPVVEDGDDDVQQALVDLPGAVSQLVEGVQHRLQVSALLQQLVVLRGAVHRAHQLGGRQQVGAEPDGGPRHGGAEHRHHVGVKGQLGLHGLLLHLRQDRVRLDETHLENKTQKYNYE